MYETIQIGECADSPEERLGWIKNITNRVNRSNGPVVLDMSSIRWLDSFFTASVAALVENPNVVGFIRPRDQRVSGYINTIGFPNGYSEADVIPTYKSYIPLTRLGRNEERSKELLKAFDSKLRSVASISTEMLNTYLQPIYELFDNFLEHSFAASGFIAGQYYPRKEYLEVTMIDTGIGFAGSYQNNTDTPHTHQEALNKAFDGISSTSDPKRGNGISKSKKIICDAMGGSMMILSGDSAVAPSVDRRRLFNLRDFCWQGVIISFRIPKTDTPINFYDIY